MGFVRVVKNKAYFKRFQVKYKRRREGKTDYQARKRLILQDKNKYKTPKYRLVVRISNKDVVCQIVSADLTHDVVVACAYAHELKRYGINLGLTNWAATYATGLLLARRVNAKFGLDYEGCTEVDGEDYNVEGDPEGNAPFKAYLDVGLARTSTGVRIWAALLGACHGGLDVPHNNKRFPGTKKDGKDFEADPEVLKKYIFGGHVADYMTQLKDDDEERYNKQFSRFIKAKIKPGDLEGLYKKAHAAIRADPNKKRDAKELGCFKTRTGKKEEPVKKRWNPKRISIEQRKNRIRQKIAAMQAKS